MGTLEVHPASDGALLHSKAAIGHLRIQWCLKQPILAPLGVHATRIRVENSGTKSRGSQLSILNIATGLGMTTRLHEPGELFHLNWSPDGSLIACGFDSLESGLSSVVVADARTGQLVATLKRIDFQDAHMIPCECFWLEACSQLGLFVPSTGAILRLSRAQPSADVGQAAGAASLGWDWDKWQPHAPLPQSNQVRHVCCGRVLAIV
ncbi:hypothetical protein WJX84_012345 [Apatococcus fuscideae]|uniref:Uncharacterized protein n=1 Tax=Apatococcus fuscideae TaxID=2026836 RepID=A0AAW1TH74_9CHLO